MQVDLKSGKYVVAVSGGVDSMVLLDVLVRSSRQAVNDSNEPGSYQLVVAHFDHGIRPDSGEDCAFVQSVARRHGLPFVYESGKLGPGVSEAAARAARYAFLRRVQKEQGASAIITAHHQDDVLETAVLNLVRGTGRKGLSSLRSGDGLVRPLLGVPKSDIIAYTRKHAIAWREDPTNTDERYLRNYIRRRILPRFGSEARRQLLARIETARRLNEEVDALLARILRAQQSARQLRRRWFVMLPYAVSCEVMAAMLRQNGVQGFTRGRIERLVAAAKTKPPGKLADVDARCVLRIEKEVISLISRRASKKMSNSV